MEWLFISHQSRHSEFDDVIHKVIFPICTLTWRINNDFSCRRKCINKTAFFSLNYKYFDQLLQTVRNKTTVLILIFKEFLQTSIRPLISVFYAKEYDDFPLKNFCLTVPKNFVEEPFFVSENFWYRKM